MKMTMILRAVAMGLAWSAAAAFGQQRMVQPSPAYYPAAPAGAQPVYYAPAPAGAQPVYYAPQPMPAGAQPVYYVPQPAPQLAMAPAFVEIEEEDEGYYWFWGSKWPGLALGPKIGTTGLGFDLVFGVASWLNLRSGFSFGDLSLETPISGVDYDTDITITSLPLLVDIHFGGNFRISGGIFFQTGSSADLLSTPTEAVQIGAHTYAPDVVGTLTGEIEVSDVVSPYIGIGFGNAVGEDQLLTFMMDIGVVFQSYDVTLTSNGAGMTTKLDTFRKDMVLEEQTIQDDVDNFAIYPVITLGVAYHF
jgi:hypothetical protein